LNFPLKDLDPNIKLLSLLTVVFATLLIVVDIILQNDSQVFQVIAQLLAGFSGALLAMIKAKAGIINGPQPPAIARAAIQSPQSPGGGPAAVVTAPAAPAPPPPPPGGGH